MPDLRVLYERALSSLPSDKAVDVRISQTNAHACTPSLTRNFQIWNDFYDFENIVSDLATVAKMEKRRLAAYPDNEAFTGMLALVQRYKCGHSTRVF